MRMLHNKVAVVAIKTVNKSSDGMFVMPEVQDNLGEVKYVPEGVTSIKPGDRVYIGPHREPIRMDGQDVMIMDITNVYAVKE